MSERDAEASLSAALGTLFPPGTVCAQLTGSGNPSILLPAEAKHLGNAVASRREEFAAGRACAARALREFDCANFPLQVGEDRRPLWPIGIIGSITHTEGFCAAVVARERDLRGVGIDTELSGRAKPELWPRICGPEIKFLASLPVAQRPDAATLIFCIKEAFYKCQYNLTRQYLGFDAARVEFDVWPSGNGSFRVYASQPMALSTLATLPLTGRFLFHQEYVTAGIAVA